ncbi:sugar ABC transporter substrate-binding protein [Blautia producta]|uniref:Sugar ABC transporter substrate-binding protein n=3 Tax=Blautia producta TaxID=33035 RepID=A0A7G5N3P1_9FIRM|nr:sugar ABC transporter substrate-binding protein [Blautia producta ATCC 27340 = DSM 2950]QMW81484.1 sugar ABC transporter substrate-binding protein [Blautia producta]
MCMMLTLIMAGSLAACGNSQADAGKDETKKENSSEKTKITFALWDEVQKPVFDQIVEKFETENPDIDVELQLTPWSQYWTKLDAAMGSDSAADVFWMNTYLPKYAEAGVLEPLDEYIEKDKVNMDDYVSVVKDAYNYNDVQYCMPKGMDTVQVFYNKGIFEKYGVEEPQTGWTWEDMKELAGQLKSKIEEAGSDEYPILMELDPQPSFFNFINQSGGYVLSDDMKKAGFDQEGTVKAYTDMVALMDEGLMPGSEVLSDTKGTDLFLSQKGAILFMGSWKTAVIDDASFAEQVGTIAMPAKDDGNQSVIGGLGYAVNSSSKDKDAAWKLVKYLAGEESNKMQAEAKIDVPALISAQQYYKAEHVDVNVIFDVAKTGFPFPTSSSVAEWLPTVNEISAKIFAKELTPEEGCKQMQEATQSALDSES